MSFLREDSSPRNFVYLRKIVAKFSNYIYIYLLHLHFLKVFEKLSTICPGSCNVDSVSLYLQPGVWEGTI